MELQKFGVDHQNRKGLINTGNRVYEVSYYVFEQPGRSSLRKEIQYLELITGTYYRIT
jgi:hypothetical protein